MVDLLIELGADPTITHDEFEATPAGWAKHAYHDALAEHLADLEQEAQSEALSRATQRRPGTVR